jgi:hypothetical protein
MASRGHCVLIGLFAIAGVALCSCSSDKESGASGSGDETLNHGGSQSAGATGGSQIAATSGRPIAGTGGAIAGGSGGKVSGSGGKAGGKGGAKAGVGGRGGSAGKAGAAGSPGIPCNPADKTPDPTVIQYSGKDSMLFENGAKYYEPEAVTGVDTPNTGPYQPIIEVYPNFDQFTIYRPDVIDHLLPIIAWGNGGCYANGTFHGEFLKEIASYGFFIIADGAPGDAVNPMTSPMSSSDGTQQEIMLDWAIAENERPCSFFYHKLDTSKISVSGNSCGGLMTMYAAPDPRVTTAVLWNSGLFARDQALYDSLHAPMAIFDGGPDDPATANAQADVDAINNVPILFANDKRGHGAYQWDDNGSHASKIAVAWWRWFLLGDKGPTGKGWFVGDNCGMCTKTDIWPDMQWKNQQLLKD